MTNLHEELKQAYAFLSAIPVSGDHVEIMAAAREHLRKAFKLAEKGEDNGGQENR